MILPIQYVIKKLHLYEHFCKDIHENLQSINIDETPVICAYICTALMMLYSNLHSLDDVVFKSAQP